MRLPELLTARVPGKQRRYVALHWRPVYCSLIVGRPGSSFACVSVSAHWRNRRAGGARPRYAYLRLKLAGDWRVHGWGYILPRLGYDAGLSVSLATADPPGSLSAIQGKWLLWG